MPDIRRVSFSVFCLAGISLFMFAIDFQECFAIVADRSAMHHDNYMNFIKITSAGKQQDTYSTFSVETRLCMRIGNTRLSPVSK